MNRPKVILLISIILVSAVICILITSKTYVSIFNANVEILTETENVMGHCQNIENMCMFTCPSCNEIFISNPEQKGPAYNVSGKCPNCEYYISF